ncbi:YfhO family protein [Bergeyella sp. RCAD1439]|uniref:YfhO family protein n=1 Tax=Bergeyella anatis TaxID=3113737 RepID=UPI002E1832B6|nr:YfhO family protein [Bergeyella sp. RCAD1439]
MMKERTKIIAVIGSIALFVILALIYVHPVLSGKAIIQPDIVHYKGGAKELLDYRAQTGEETYWSDSMFGGMPTYQIGAQFRGDWIKQVDYALNFLPRPANYLFLLFLGFFLLGMVVTKRWTYALLGASFFGLSTYFYIIIAAGHNGKVHTIAYFAPLLAGILLVYVRKKYILGFILTALAMGLQIAANHPQMTYYLFIALAFLFLSELVRTAKQKETWRHFLISTGILASAFAIGIGMNAQRLLANAEYVKETTRGKQILTNERHQSEASGLDKESITMWSYGKLETLNLFIPRLMGGGSQEPGAEKMLPDIQEMFANASDHEKQMISQALGSLTYWGDQPGTSGPAYQGAVVIFLAVLGFFFAAKKYRYWILGASVLTILLAWGHHFAPLTDFFIESVPLYNKFRAPSSILVVVELLFPLIAILGIYRFYNDPTLEKPYREKILLSVSGGLLGLLLVFLLFGKSLFGFHTANEKQYLPPYFLDYLTEFRFAMFREDVLKAMLYVGITAAALWFSAKQKLSQNLALVVIGLVSLFDLWSVNKRYLNEGNFVEKTFAETPFLTENSDFLSGKAAENPYLQGLLSQVNLNKTLEEIAEKDPSHYRIYNQTLGTFSETNTSYFKSSIGGYSAAKLRRYDDLINHYFSEIDTAKVPRILNMLNAKYMIFGNAEQPQAVMNPNANGNAWLVSDIHFAQTPNEEIEAIGTIDNKKTAVVSASDKAYFNGKTLAKDSTAFVTLKHYRPNQMTFETQSKTPQLAVFSEIYYPHGWKVILDGKEVPYLKANYLLRAVHVPAGKHTVTMTFEPEVIRKGKTLSRLVFGLFILLSVLDLGYRLKQKSNKTAS